MLNAIGLANPGRERFLAETLPRIIEVTLASVWVSVGGFTARDYAETCERLTRDDVACIELNLSCPNVDEAPECAAEIVAECREMTKKSALRQAFSAFVGPRGNRPCSRGGGRRRSQSRQHTARCRARRGLRPVLARGAGGYSGPALKPVALAAVRAARKVTQLPIVGMGGVQTGRDALELIACGATHVALGTILFADPFAPQRVRDELVDEVALAGFESPDDAFCAAFDAVVKMEN